MIVQGSIRIGEATPTLSATSRRLRGGAWRIWLTALAMWLAGAAIGCSIGVVVGYDPVLCGCGGALVGVFLCPRVFRGLVVRLQQKSLMSRGTPLDLPVRFEVTPEAFVYEIADVRMIAKWCAVTDVFHAKGWWIFLVQSDAWFAADRFFAGDEECRAFLRAVLCHMSDAARARSGEAVRFAG
jgi:hypothetical protein